MNVEARARIEFDELLDGATMASLNVVDEKRALVPGPPSIPEEPEESKFYRRHPNVEHHSADDQLTDVFKPLSIEVLVYAGKHALDKISLASSSEIPSSENWHYGIDHIVDRKDSDDQMLNLMRMSREALKTREVDVQVPDQRCKDDNSLRVASTHNLSIFDSE